MNWDEWVGSSDGRPAMLTKKFFKRICDRLGWQIAIHKFLRGDDPGCFHSHPALAIRLILWGGYYEELYGEQVQEVWKAGRVGLVRPETFHRVDKLYHKDRPSYSLWIRFKKAHEIRIQGPC